VFLYEIKKDQVKAIQVGKLAFDSAINDLQ
jgi:hypothetical protein